MKNNLALYVQKIKNLKHWATSQFYHNLYGQPSKKLKIIGVTGTDGKTTTSNMLYEILKKSGKKIGVISTIKAVIGDKEYPTGFHVTTPDANMLQKFLKEMVEAGIEYVVLETTSHGLDQYRVHGIEFAGAIFTNVTHEHLDYHKTYENYLNAKSKLIDLIKKKGFVVMNADDRSYKTLNEKAKRKGLDRVSFSIRNRKKGGVYATGIELADNHSDFQINSANKNFSIRLNIPGEYNIYNALAASAAALLLKINSKDIKKALKNLPRLEGRWNLIQETPFQVVVDFAHTPNALEGVLSFAKSNIRNGRIIVVFGCASKRDIEKRPIMGEIAGRLSDITILTAEDPRGESVQKINKEIAAGLLKLDKIEGKDFYSIDDRRSAIEKALELASPGDLVIITGKGHEKSMNLDGKKEIPWNDEEIIRNLLKNS